MYHGPHGAHQDERLLLIIIDFSYVRRKEEKVRMGLCIGSYQSRGHTPGWLRRWQCNHVIVGYGKGEYVSRDGTRKGR